MADPAAQVARRQTLCSLRESVSGHLTIVRRANDGDVARLVAWHADPEVSRYWDDKTFTPDEMRDRLVRSDVDAWIVEADGEPVGYVQSYRWGIDGFLIPSARGKGLMPDAAHALASSLIADGWPEVIVDPYEWNDRAIRAWQKAGFVEIGRRPPDEDHPSPWILMRFAATLTA
jgi:aminoglycoside 6'-N-acetyltransferase